MKVSAQPYDPGISGWNAILRDGQRYPELNQDRTADWLVIGAGFAGLSAARRLRQLHPGDQIVILEARKISEGPAGRNSGFMIDLPHVLSSQDYKGELGADRLQTEMNRKAIKFANEAAKEYEMPANAIINCGKINAAATTKGLEKNRVYAGHLSKLDEPHELLDEKQMQEICGSQYYKGGLHTPGTAVLQPALYVRSLASGLGSNDIDIHENTPVIELKKKGKNWNAVTPTGAVEAPRVILAVNGHAESFGFFRQSLMHVYLYASMTRPLSEDELKFAGGSSNWGFTPSDPMGSTVRKFTASTGSRIVVRNRFTWSPSRNVNENKLKSVAGWHDKSFQNRFPQLKKVDMQYRWGGLLCLSRNEVSAFGELKSGLYSACCQNGLGTARGTLNGILAAELASGVSSVYLNSVLAQPAPKKLPPEPFASVGANLYMRWLEFAAGAEL